jgi:hypothetical protein
MSQMAYQEALDPYHALFRLLRIGRIVGTDRSLSIAAARIADFYLLFPFRIQGFRLKVEHLRFRSMSKKYEVIKPYGDFPGDRAVFARMSPIQDAAFTTALHRGVIDSQEWVAERIKFLDAELPDVVDSRIESLNAEQEDIVEFLLALINDYPVMGMNGIKDRSKLLEHRYDSVA